MSLKVKVYNQKGEASGEIELSDKVFSVETNEFLVHQAMVTQMGNERQVIAHTKTRAEVRGGGRNPWRQKGTGRARAGSNRSPIWIGGGITFGPRSDKNYKKKINKKMKQKALMMVLSDRVASKNFVVLENLKLKEFKTKSAESFLKTVEDKIIKEPKLKTKDKKTRKPKRSILILIDEKSDETKFSFRNLQGIKLLNIDNFNILDLLKYRNLILTKISVAKLQKVYE